MSYLVPLKRVSCRLTSHVSVLSNSRDLSGAISMTWPLICSYNRLPFVSLAPFNCARDRDRLKYEST